jgi:cytochrome c
MAALAAAATVSTAAQAAGDAKRGEDLYESRCTGCHSVDEDRVGPRHRDVVGRKAGAVAGFDYSPALKKTGFAWDAARLDRWLADPEKLVPGQKMGYSVPEAGDRADLIAYLASVSKR